MDILIRVLQVVLSISILVITHEGGHFFFAKLFKTRVEKFYLFFDPWFSLFKFKKGETEYGIGWLPLGGYVKISGMIDESMDTDQMQQPVQPWEFRAKPAWQRLLIMLGGVMVNLITAPLLFWMILYVWGETYLPLNEAQYGLRFHKVMHEAGFVDGDRIVGINGVSVETYKDMANPILLEDETVVNIVRDGAEMEVKMPHEFYRRVLSENVSTMFVPLCPAVIEEIAPDGGAAAAGLVANDSIIGFAGEQVASVNDFANYIADKKDTSVAVVYVRQGVVDTTMVNINSNGKVGLVWYGPYRWMNEKHREYGLFEAFPAGVAKGYDLLCNYLKQIPMLFTKEGATKVGGFGTIGKMFPTTWDWESFWYITAFMAIMLGVVNVLPIPALDGGHAMFLLIEMITGKKISDEWMERFQTLGMILLLALMLYANGGDIVRAIFD